MPKKLSYHKVCELIKDIGESELLSTEYVNSETPLLFKCQCGNTFKRSFAKYYHAKQYVCPKCAKARAVDSERLSIDDVKEYIRQHGCEYVGGEYKNTTSPLTMRCDCGNIFVKDFAHFKRGQTHCAECGRKLLRLSKMKYDIDTVRESLAKKGYILLDTEYVDCETPLHCRCSAGHEFTIKFSYFLVGHSGCKKCANENLRGENHYNYKGGESEVVDYFRKHIVEWKRKVAQKYNYKCALTGSKRDCVVHHLKSFNTILNEALQSLGLPLHRKINEYTKEQFQALEKCVLSMHTVDNGILLQRKVHNKFHSLYGKGNNMPEQFDEFVKTHY